MPGGELPPGIFRWAIAVEYCGDHYHGWQRLSGRNEPTVQACVESALSVVAAEMVTVVCAGRTDSGVHATNQILHFDTTADRPDKAWVLGGNSQLPGDIRIKWACKVEPQFHARFSARARTYRYLIANTPAQSAVAAGKCLWVRKPIDVDAMQLAANFFLGEHDFSSVRGSSCQARSPVRTIHHFRVTKVNHWVVVEICGNAFLHHMVRNLMGLLLPVGLGLQAPVWVSDVLAARDRKAGGKTEAPGALYLVKVDYDKDYGLPVMPKGPFMLPDSL
ncbi:MAG TPA: tRNA pseudouridine(38-40) synthase TruA [Pseudomonadales bacterium]|nr:tRNA pseudouridine(38-40) synthase TruA [Pseudomonadales bacterium]